LGRPPIRGVEPRCHFLGLGGELPAGRGTGRNRFRVPTPSVGYILSRARARSSPAAAVTARHGATASPSIPGQSRDCTNCLHGEGQCDFLTVGDGQRRSLAGDDLESSYRGNVWGRDGGIRSRRCPSRQRGCVSGLPTKVDRRRVWREDFRLVRHHHASLSLGFRASSRFHTPETPYCRCDYGFKACMGTSHANTMDPVRS
jgi:hypothetical protein